jgi:hypothetical protein
VESRPCGGYAQAVVKPASDKAEGGGLVFGCALAFWLIVPVPFLLLGMGFGGRLMLLPDTWNLMSVLWVIAFYAPLVLMAYVAVHAVRSRSGQDGDKG